MTVLTQPGHEGMAYEITGPELLTCHDVAKKKMGPAFKDIAANITVGNVLRTIEITHEGMKALKIPNPRLAVAALNPQAWMATAFPYWEGPISITGSHTGRGQKAETQNFAHCHPPPSILLRM